MGREKLLVRINSYCLICMGIQDQGWAVYDQEREIGTAQQYR